jgi:uncharacterized heparinase superfamily protein
LGYTSEISNDSELETIGYEDAGIYILRKKVRNYDISCLFKAGPFGYKSISAHSHADSLSFILYVNGIPIFVDSGTYCYHTDLKFRKYFRGTSSHNTLVVNHMDQSEQLGPFLWGPKAKTRVSSFIPEENFVKAHHSGYKRYHILHSRTITLKEQMKIMDEVSGKGPHVLDFRFHLHPDISIRNIDKNIVSLGKDDIELVLKNDQDLQINIISGSKDGGWYSPQFNVKVPTHTLSYQKKVYLPIKQTFSIEF